MHGWQLEWKREKERREELEAENASLRELFYKTYCYYVSGTLTPCDFCDKYCCEGDAPTTCKADEYDPAGIVRAVIESSAQELGIVLPE
jgi:hypothetical protein